jgi:Flp pilus assembly pilin Flp
MFRLIKNKKGQNTAEYAILIGLVIAAVIAMQTYVKRGLQGRFADEVDDMAAQTSELGSTKQYEPYYLDSSFTTTTTKDEMVQTGQAKAPTIDIDRDVSSSGTQTLKHSSANIPKPK